MKKIILIMFLLIHVVCAQRLFAQSYDLNALSNLFAKDVQLMSNSTDKYLPQKTKSLSYTHSSVLRLNKISNVSSGINRILIIVNSPTYSPLKNKIERYAYDINYIYGCEVIMEIVTNADHFDIKNLILSNGSNLNGVVLIGDLPTAWFETANDHNKYGYEMWPCDLYYMDINGTWSDVNNNGIFDSHSGDVKPEIFIGRISAANMGTLVTENEALEKYFDKNHKFWLGQLTVNKKFGLAYTDKDWANTPYFLTDIKNVYGTANYDDIHYGGYSSFGKSDYVSRLSNSRYEFIQLASHSSASYHAFSNGDYYADEIFRNGTEAIGYNLFCCSACRWTSANPTEGFLAGAYIYNNNTSGLVVVGSTKIGSMLYFNAFYSALGAGKTFGESLTEWWITVCGSSHSLNDIYWYYGLAIIGDPMVNLLHCMNNRCQNSLTLTTFDNSINSPTHHIAKDNIKTTNNVNYIIPSNKHVVINAKTVELNTGFECQVGGELNIYSEGCNSNCP